MRQPRSFPPAASARQELERLGADETKKAEVVAGRALQELMGGVDTSKPAVLRKLLVDLDRFGKKNAGTYAAKQADAQYTRLAGR